MHGSVNPKPCQLLVAGTLARNALLLFLDVSAWSRIATVSRWREERKRACLSKKTSALKESSSGPAWSCCFSLPQMHFSTNCASCTFKKIKRNLMQPTVRVPPLQHHLGLSPKSTAWVYHTFSMASLHEELHKVTAIESIDENMSHGCRWSEDPPFWISSLA